MLLKSSSLQIVRFKNFGTSANVEKSFFGVFKFGVDQKLAPDENHSAIATKEIFIEPISLAHETFYAVANDSPAEFFARREADFAVKFFVMNDEQNQRMIRKRFAAIVYRVEIVLAAKNFALLEFKQINPPFVAKKKATSISDLPHAQAVSTFLPR